MQVVAPEDAFLQENATYTTHAQYSVHTGQNRQDHSFFGIMFDLEVKETVPCEFLELYAIGVRGQLGDIGIWYCRGSYNDNYSSIEENWTNVFEGELPPSPRRVRDIRLNEPLRVEPGETIGLYVHTDRDDDRGIVYDNQRNDISHEDRFIRVLPGVAHTSPIPFSNDAGMFGFWAWRPHREFVGRLSYGVRYVLWRPRAEVNDRFHVNFQKSVLSFISCSYHEESILSLIPQGLLYYIINMLPYNWFAGTEVEEAAGRRESYAAIGWGGNNDYRLLIAQHQARVLEQLLAAGEIELDDIEEDDDF